MAVRSGFGDIQTAFAQKAGPGFFGVKEDEILIPVPVGFHRLAKLFPQLFDPIFALKVQRILKLMQGLCA